MGTIDWRPGLAVALALVLALPVGTSADSPASSTVWQGQGQGQGQGRGQGNQGRGQGNQGNRGRGNDERRPAQGNPGRAHDNQPAARGNQGPGNQGRGNAAAAQANRGRGNSGRAARGNPARPDPARLRASMDRLPEPVRRMASSDRADERIVAGALARAAVRGVDARRFRVENASERVRVRNTRDEVLLDMDAERARELGHWEMRRLGDRTPAAGSPAFCRSGAGHPVWGREWCLEKGFGLGVNERSIWSRTADVDDIRFEKRPTRDVLDRGGLIDVLGDIVFGRLAVQSLILGYDEPLAGRWVASDEPDSPFVLRISAGDVAVAELVDSDRDDDVDVLFVAQPRY